MKKQELIQKYENLSDYCKGNGKAWFSNMEKMTQEKNLELLEILHTGNTTSRLCFSFLTGIELPKTEKGTIETLKNFIGLEVFEKIEQEEREKENLEKLELENQKQQENKEYNFFLENKTALQIARIKKELSVQKHFAENGKIFFTGSIKGLIEFLHNEKMLFPKIEEVQKRAFSRTKYNRMTSCKEQDKYIESCKETKKDYRIYKGENFSYSLGKIAYEYAVHIQDNEKITDFLHGKEVSFIEAV